MFSVLLAEPTRKLYLLLPPPYLFSLSISSLSIKLTRSLLVTQIQKLKVINSLYALSGRGNVIKMDHFLDTSEKMIATI